MHFGSSLNQILFCVHKLQLVFVLFSLSCQVMFSNRLSQPFKFHSSLVDSFLYILHSYTSWNFPLMFLRLQCVNNSEAYQSDFCVSSLIQRRYSMYMYKISQDRRFSSRGNNISKKAESQLDPRSVVRIVLPFSSLLSINGFTKALNSRLDST